MSKCKFGWIGEGDIGMTCTNKARGDGYCDSHKPAGTIDLTPSWAAMVRIYLDLLDEIPCGYEDKDKKRADMKAEIMRAAELADLYVKEHKR